MGSLQSDFLEVFKTRFAERFKSEPTWTGGQVLSNCAHLPRIQELRRGGITRAGERYELGDLRADVDNRTVIVEYDDGCVSTHNLLKYWPYVRGELSLRPTNSVVLFHFSNWGSYGTYRDTWQWLLSQMKSDPHRIVNITARQFDHGGKDTGIRASSVISALDWIEGLQNAP